MGTQRVNALNNNALLAGVYEALLVDSLGREFSIPRIEFKAIRPPEAPSIVASSDTSFCATGSVKLSAVGKANSFIWNTGSLEKEITVSKTGQFKVKLVDDKGCVSGDSKAINTQTYPIPVAPQISVMSPYYLTTGTRTVGSNYSWYFNGNLLPASTDLINLHVKDSGLYQAKISVSYPKGPTCVSNFSNEIRYELPKGIGLVTFPNPASKELFVQSKYDLSGAKYTLYGLDGREMLQGSVRDNLDFYINVSGLAPGVYKLVIVPTNGPQLLQETIIIENR